MYQWGWVLETRGSGPTLLPQLGPTPLSYMHLTLQLPPVPMSPLHFSVKPTHWGPLSMSKGEGLTPCLLVKKLNCTGKLNSKLLVAHNPAT